MVKRSAGIIPYRFRNGRIEVFLVHPGGPFWEKKDDGAWSIAKGECEDGEDTMHTARREFAEETGFTITGELMELSPVVQPSGKVIVGFFAEMDLDPQLVKSNTFPLEWPPHSGRMQAFPEIDCARWFSLPEARVKIVKGQLPILEELERKVKVSVDKS